MKDTKHIWRIFLLLVIGICLFMVGRLFFVPKTFGTYGHYRAANVAEQRAIPVKIHGPEACEPCHGDEFTLWKSAAHKTIICEDCHAPYSTHIKNDEKYADMEISKRSDLCLRCHQEMRARPKDFPQINLDTHAKDNGITLTATICFSCHNPHDPTPKETTATAAKGR